MIAHFTGDYDGRISTPLLLYIFYLIYGVGILVFCITLLKPCVKRQTFFLVCIYCVMLSVTDRFGGSLLKLPMEKDVVREEQFIRLKKFPPNLNTSYRPSNEYMQNTDGLIQQDYPLRTDVLGFIMPTRKYPLPEMTIVST